MIPPIPPLLIRVFLIPRCHLLKREAQILRERHEGLTQYLHCFPHRTDLLQFRLHRYQRRAAAALRLANRIKL
jgi:hypothetical protein